LAVRLVRPGGTLVYATCSLEPQEGEAPLGDFLATRRDFTIDRVRDDELPAGLVPDAAGWLRIVPGMMEDQGGCDGFFIARLRRTA
jgi:16S rRNA (cytosine967-C5)-methyltransferase